MLLLKLSVEGEEVVAGVGLVGDAGLLVLADLLLEEVGLAAQRDVLHEVERVLAVEHLVALELDEQPIGHVLDVGGHEARIHADEVDAERIGEKLLLDAHSVADDLVDARLRGLVGQVAVHEAGEVGVEALVAADELVAEGEAGHEAALLQPEDGGERAGEEDALDGREGDDALGKGGHVVAYPAQRPLGLLLHARQILDGVEQVALLLVGVHVRVDEQRVHLRVDVLHGHLALVEVLGLDDLHLVAEALDQVGVDDAVRGGEERQHVLDEVLLLGLE